MNLSFSRIITLLVTTFSCFSAIGLGESNTVNAREISSPWVLPTQQTKTSRPFEPPAQNWLAGHRGVDFRGQLGDQVFAAGSGVVIFADVLAGKGVVVISHGLIRTTYEPLDIQVSVGDQVSLGQVIGTLATGISHCATEASVWCLHWGAIRDGKYLNPLLLVYPRVRLLPLNSK